MQHFNDFLNSKKLPLKEILGNYCEITEKIDGNAFQVYTENDDIVFAKRGNSPSVKSSNIINEFDLVIDMLYYHAVTYMSKFKEVLKKYSILNFEIFESSFYNTHIISYGNKYKNGIVLLSGYDFDGNILPHDTLESLAAFIEVSCNSNIWEGYMEPEFIDELINNKNDYNGLWNLAVNKYCQNIDTDNIEGLVFNYKTEDTQKRILKIQNPDFQEKILKHLNTEKSNKVKNCEHIYNHIISVAQSNMLKRDYDDCLLTTLLKLYLSCESDLHDFNFENTELKYNEVINTHIINMLQAQKYFQYLPDNMHEVKYPYLLMFIILAFRNKRKKYPVCCSLEYQLNIVNPFIDKLLK